MYNFASYLSTSQLENYQTYLFVGPHPSDIDIACGGLVSKLISKNKTVHYLICTKGGYASNDSPSEMAEEQRKKEATCSAQFMKIKSINFLKFNNFGLYLFDDMKKAIIEKIVEIKPDVIIAPDFFNSNDLNPDHYLVAQAVRHSFLFCMYPAFTASINIHGTASPQMLALYWSENPNTYIDVEEFIKQKFDSISYHKSIFPVSPGDDISYELEYIKQNCMKELRDGGEISNTAYAECYRILTKNGENNYPSLNIHPILDKD